MAAKNREAIERHYDETQILYSLFWPNDALHYGIWEEGTRTLAEAVDNNSRLSAQLLNANERSRLLDAGCGIGGTCRFIARHFGSYIHGITLSETQLIKANKRAEREYLSDRVSFSKQDFTQTSFPDSTFDGVYGIESVCHAIDKERFVREAYRILKRGGRIAVTDGFIVSEPEGKGKELYERLLWGWELPSLSTVQEFQDTLKERGFKNIKFFDHTSKIQKTKKRVYIIGCLAYPIITMGAFLRILPKHMHQHNTACLTQKTLFDRGIGVYGSFTAEK